MDCNAGAVKELGNGLSAASLRVFRFYSDGFRGMTLGKTLWKLIIIKLVIMFGVLKLFFFQDYLGTNFQTDRERADHVLGELVRPVNDMELMNKEQGDD